ncbi:MAG: metal ABC transporter substrate-binding protein [Oscillospiraceae bacterium]|nr:metal ABC transporter substrate-binding protein [Oscillospiraceae bacterium]
MKRFVTTLCCLLAFVGILASCDWQNAPNDDGRVRVVSTLFASYDFLRAIAGDSAALTMLLPPGAESHSYEPTPQDILTVQNCDVFVYVGGESDAWVENLLAAVDQSKLRIVTLIDCVETVDEAALPGIEAEEEEAPETDEHVWTSPRNAALIVQRLRDVLQEVDPAHEDLYRQNTENSLSALNALDARFKAIVAGGARKTLVFGDRFPFRYFADAYGLTCYAAFPGCSPETEASAKTVQFLVDTVRTEKIPVVLHIEMGNEKMATAIAEATGAQVLELHAAHNITADDFRAGVTYLDIMERNAAVLKTALG